MLVTGLNKKLGSTGSPNLGLLGREDQHIVRVLLNSQWCRNPKYDDLEHQVSKAGLGSAKKCLSHC